MMIRNLKHKIVASLSCVVFLSVLFSCGQKDQYFRYNELKDAKWMQHDSLVFNIDSATVSVGVPYDVYIEITNNVSYPYQNLWFFINDDFAGDTIYNRTEKEFVLADNQGKWLGSGFGSLYQSTFLYKEHVVFKESKSYALKIEHAMTDNPLVGIEKVGVRLSYKY